MALNLGTITYGDMWILSAEDPADGGIGNLNVSGNTLLSGTYTNVQGTFTAIGGTTLSSTLTVGGASTFNAPSTFNDTATFRGGFVIANTTDSTSTTTGALQVAGGVGIGLSTNIGSTLTVGGGTSLGSTLNVTGASTFQAPVSVLNTTESTAYTNGALTVAGGLGVAGNIQSGVGNLYLAGNLILKCDSTSGIAYLNSPAGNLYINNAGTNDVFVNPNSTANFNVSNAINVNTSGLQVLTNTDSTAVTNGGLTVAGGAGIGMTLNVGGDINAPITSTLTIGSLVSTATTQSTSITTGAITTAGGVGIAKNVFVGGRLDVASTADTYSNIGNVRILSLTSGANWIQSGDLARTDSNWTPLKFSPLASTTSIMTINADNVSIDSATAATNTTTGAFTVSGGVGISGDVFIGASANIAGITNHLGNVWMTGNSLFLGTFNDQTSGLVYSATTSAGGPFLFGFDGGALGTTDGGQRVALTWDTTQSVQVIGATETTSTTTGALTVSGGVGIAKSASIGTTLFVQGGSWTSTGTDVYLNAGTSNINIRNTVNSDSGEFESSMTDFNFRTRTVTTPSVIAPFVTFNISKTTGYVTVRQTDDATGDQTGAFQVLGGASVSKSLWVGNDTTIVGNLSVTGSVTTGGASPLIVANTTNSTSSTTGAVVIAGGIGIGANLYADGLIRFTNTTDTTDPTTGALVVTGGTGIGGSLQVGGSGTFGGDLTVAGNITSTSGTISFSNTTATTSTTTGAVVIGGGVGIGGGIYVGGVSNFTNTTNSTSTTTGSIVTPGGLGVGGAIYAGGIISVTNTTGSTSTTTGSFVTGGGVGIGENLNVGGDATVSGSLLVTGNISSTGGAVTFTNTLDSTSPTTGSVIVAGGVGIAKSLFVGSTANSTSIGTGGVVLSGGLGVALDFNLGGNQTLAGTNPLLTFNNSGLAIPSFATRSVGTKVLYYDSLSPTSADFATGMDTDVLWNSVPVNADTNSFAWYGGTTLAMSLNGIGVMALMGTVDATSSTTGALQVSGGVGVARNLFVGQALDIGTTSYFRGGVTAATNVTVGGLLSSTNSTNSTAPNNGAIATAGGLGVVLNANIGQNLSVGGNFSVTGTSTLTGAVSILDSTESTSITTGSLVTAGGLGVGRSANIGGPLVVNGTTTINGNLYVSGITTQIDTEVLSTKDNVFLVNNGPSGTANSGYAMKRYQFANDTGLGDVVTDTVAETSGTAQAGSTATTIVLGTDASAVNDWYNGGWVMITGGTGAGQVRRINTYVGATRTATIYTSADQASLAPLPVEGLDWTTVPDATSTYSVFTSQYIVTIYDETSKEYAIGSTAVNPVNGPVTVRNRIRVHTGTLRLDRKLYTDSILENTAGAGTDVNGVLIKSGGVVSGISSINGGLVDVTGQVTLVDNDATAIATLPGTNTFGAYQVLVSDVNNTGAAATFFISSSSGRAGNVFRATGSPGANNEHLTIKWPAGSQPGLKFMQLPTNGTGATYTYVVKVSRVVV